MTDNTQKPLERAARALAEFDTERDIGWRYYVPEARAVLLAIREPSEAMVEAARFETNGQDRWQAMIDAALGE